MAKRKILGAVVLVKLDDEKIYQAKINHTYLLAFIDAIGTAEGSLSLIENEIQGVDLIIPQNNK